MAQENYWLACYQAVLEKNATKLLKLDDFSEKERENYSEEYPELDFNQIFKDKNPLGFIYSLLGREENKEFLMEYEAIDESLNTPENIAKREDNKLELMKHPLMHYSPNPAYGLSVIDSFLSMAYSAIINKQEIIIELTTIIEKLPIIADILSVVVTSNFENTCRPLFIALVGDDINEYNPTLESSTGGIYHPIYNDLIITNDDLKFNLGFIVHELAHKIMNILFDNDANPYHYNTKTIYHQALSDTLVNIKEFIKQDFGLEISVKDQNDTWQMGKLLSTMLFPQYLHGEQIKEFIELFKQYHLNIGDRFSWLSEYSPLSLAMDCKNFELAESLVWAEAITTANPFIYEGICDANSGFQESNNKQKHLDALETLLNFYNQGYDKENEDGEFIVRLPQIMSQGLYADKIIDVFQPLMKYWMDEINPALQAHIDQYSVSDICLPLGEYADLFEY